MEFAAKRRASSDTPASVRLAIIGCFVVGGIGIIKALEMSSPSGILLCLLGSVAAFGAVIFFRTRKQ